jgi:hypothetical protein
LSNDTILGIERRRRFWRWIFLYSTYLRDGRNEKYGMTDTKDWDCSNLSFSLGEENIDNIINGDDEYKA